MSVWLQELIENDGYDIINNPEDAKWLLSQKDEFGVLCEKAERCVEEYEDYLDHKETAEDDGDYNYPSFQEWLKLREGVTNE